MYKLALGREFIARHYLIGGDFGPENQEHSHAYRLEVRLAGESLDRHGYLVDLVALEQAVEEAIRGFRDRCLNDLPEFTGLNPSLERFCQVIWQRLRASPALAACRLEVRLWESQSAWAAYEGA